MHLTYNICTQYTLQVNDVEDYALTKVLRIAFRCNHNDHVIMVALDDLRLVTTHSKYTRINDWHNLQSFIRAVARCCAQICDLDIAITQIDIIPHAATHTKLFIYKNSSPIAIMYIDGFDSLQAHFMKLHREYMKRHSACCNEKMLVPLTIGKAVIDKVDLVNLAIGDIIIFNDFYGATNKFNVQLDNCYFDLEKVN